VKNAGTVSIVTPDEALIHRLPPVARRIFSDTFAHRYDAAEFEAFSDAVYSPGGSMARDFTAPGVRWQVATVDDQPVGYAKLTPLRAPFADARDGALELQQIYLLSDWQGSGLADRLMDWALGEARAARAPEIYLTVFDHNERARRFYTRHGFRDVGRCTFQLGSSTEEDRIWRRELAATDI
jgi:GNAT superfamily N-acetyltransferase